MSPTVHPSDYPTQIRSLLNSADQAVNLVYPIGRPSTKGTELKLRLLSRVYLGLTALFYCFVGVAFASDSLRLSGAFDPGMFWACAFIFAGVLSGLAWFTLPYYAARRALAVCAVVALGFSFLFLSKVAQGDINFLLGTVVWSYLALSNFTVMKMPDPYIISLMESETAKLRDRASTLRHGN